MKRFEHRQVREARDYAVAGGQALHVWDAKNWPRDRVPPPFKRTRIWAHLFDQDAERLERTARRLGVRVVVISHRGQPGQHVDLCGKPLERAINEAAASQGDSHRARGD